MHAFSSTIFYKVLEAIIAVVVNTFRTQILISSALFQF